MEATVAHFAGGGPKQKGCKRQQQRAADGAAAAPRIMSVSRCVIRRLARRGGITKPLSDGSYTETRLVLKRFLTALIRDTVTFTEDARRSTVTPADVVGALRLLPRTQSGFVD